MADAQRQSDRQPGRGRLSSFDLLPREVDDIVAWAATELGNRDRTQKDIYAEFVQRCDDRMAEMRGEIDFVIPSYKSFNQHSLRLARMSAMLDKTREIAAVVAGRFDAQTSDDISVFTAETIKSLVLFMLNSSGELDISASKNLMELASALRQATQAQTVSSERRRRAEAEIKEKVAEAVTSVARVRGLSAETVEAIQAQVLGVST